MRLFALSLLPLLALVAVAVPPPPADFTGPQSPTKPLPFPVKMIDQGQYDPKLKGYYTPEGFRLDIVASDPVIVNPVGLTFAPDGTLFVLEWKPDPFSDGRWFEFKETFRYRDGTTKQVATMKKFVGDPLKQLKLNPKTGQYDSAQVIIVDELPSTVLYHDGWIYLTGRGTVRRYRQSKAGGLWDIKEVIAQGFCGFHHHQVSGLTIGNDGKLYITSGDDDNFVEGSDGSRATVLRCGAVFRCNLDGSQMETFSIGYRNPYRDLAHDTAFNWFHTDNDNEDGSRFTGCRIMHVAEESDFGWRLKIGARCCQPDHGRGAVAGELPGKMPPMVKTGRGSPAGMLIYNDTKLPERYRGLFYYPDVFRKVVRAYRPKANGSTFDIDAEFEFLKSDDPLFRPCQMVTGPDGAIYICDWRTDSGGAGRLWGDGVNGRIYKLRWVGTKDEPELPLRGMDSWAKLLKASGDDLVKALAAPDFSDRLVARNELIRRGDGSRGLVLKTWKDIPAVGKLVALGVLNPFWNEDVESLFCDLALDGSTDLRRLAIESLGLRAKPGSKRTLDTMAKAAHDADPAVRRAAVLALPRVDPGCSGVVIAAWKENKIKDVYLEDAYLRALERLGQQGIDALVEAAKTGDAAKRDRVALAFTSLRTKPAYDALPKLIAAEYFTPGQRADLIRSYSNYLFDPMPSPDKLAEFLAARPNESAAVLLAGVEVLSANGGLGTPAGTKLVTALLDSKDSDTRIAGLQAVEQSRVTATLSKVTAIAIDDSRSVGERGAALRAASIIGNSDTAATVRKLLDNVKEAIAIRGEALRSLAALDAKSGRATAEKMLDNKDTALVAIAVEVLGSSKDGAKLIGERFVAKKLPVDLWPRVSEALRKFATDPAIAKLNADVQKGGLLLSTAPGDIAKVVERVRTQGNADRGRALYLDSKKLACTTCHRLEGTGGQVGPDLTRGWDTQSIEKLIEAMAQPSKEIKEGYQSYRLDTLDGQAFTGLKISESKEEVVIREATGRDVRVKRADVDKLAPSKVSLMPDDVIAQLSYDQFIDLVAFLKNRSAQESLRGMAFEFAVSAGHGPKGTAAIESNPDPTKKPPAGNAWEIAKIQPDGSIMLKADSVCYALTYVHSPKAQKGTITYRSDGAIKLWFGKSVVADRTKPLPAEKVAVELPAGWTPVLVRITPAGRARQLALQFEGDGVRTATKPD
jgi:quinoprotein glucose dehydrogenase